MNAIAFVLAVSSCFLAREPCFEGISKDTVEGESLENIDFALAGLGLRLRCPSTVKGELAALPLRTVSRAGEERRE